MLCGSKNKGVKCRKIKLIKKTVKEHVLFEVYAIL